MNFSLTQEQYESLIALARQGASGDSEKLRRLEEWLRLIEKQNGIERDIVLVQWQELDAPLPPTANFPTNWPPEMRYLIELVSRKVSRVDVDAVLAQHAKNPTSVLCTRDPAGLVGWTSVDQFFLT